MRTSTQHPSTRWQTYRLWLVLVIALLIRIVHLASTATNPLTFHLSADGGFYHEFALNVASGQGGLAAQMVFVDPLYGYLLGGLYTLFGPDKFIVFLLQMLLDTLTVYLVYLIARRLWSEPAGVAAGLLYALTSTALMYAGSLLKPTLVGFYLAAWVYLGLSVAYYRRLWPWAAYGVFIGLGVALRTNLLLLTAFAAGFSLWSWWARQRADTTAVALRAVMLVVGLSLPFGGLVLRNLELAGTASILPSNGGIALYQLYNDENPHSGGDVPHFVLYNSPVESWYGFKREAETRNGRDMKPFEVGAYWQAEAHRWIADHWPQVISNMTRKLSEFPAWHEVSNNRSLAEERLFSPLIAALPPPFGILFALGVPGMVLLLWRSPQGLWLLAPIGLTLATFVVFFAMSRYRFHAVPLFAVAAGVTIAAAIGWWRQRAHRKLGWLTVAVFTCALLSWWSTSRIGPSVVNWERVAWSLVKTGAVQEADQIVQRELKKRPLDPGLWELRGFSASLQERHRDAIALYQRSLELDATRHRIFFNIAHHRRELNQPDAAIAALHAAIALAPLPDYLVRLGELLEQTERPEKAIQAYREALATERLDPAGGRNITLARERLAELARTFHEFVR